MTASKVLIVCLVLAYAFTDASQSFPAPRHNASTKAAYNFGVDFFDFYGSSSFMSCIYKKGYDTVFIEAASYGSLNSNLLLNLNNAAAANLGNEIYVIPAPERPGSIQFDDVFNKLKDGGIQLRSIWLQITTPIKWSKTNIQTNIDLIQSFISRANNKGVSAGIYTNWYDWQQITGSYSGFSGLRLWYWNALGQGPNAESPATFDDFRAFAGWTKPTLKQFAINEDVCGLTLNRIVYPSGSRAAEINNQIFNGNVTVGGVV